MRAFCLVPLIVLGVAACKPAAEPKPEATASGEVGARPGVVENEARLVLPAVAGNPGVAYFTLTNSSTVPITLAAVAIDGADKAEMHETSGGSMAPLAKLDIPAGKTATFSPGGKHVMVFGLDPKLAAGATVDMTITFADGDKLTTPLKVEAAGMAMEHDR